MTDTIAPLPEGPNQLTGQQRDVIDERQVVFVSGETDPTYPLVSGLLVHEYEIGRRVTMDMSQAQRLERWYRHRIPGYHMSLVMKCANDCPYKKQCPIDDVGLALPLARHCPWEAGLFKARVVALCQELSVNPTKADQYVDYNTIRDIAATEMLLERVAMELSLDPISIKAQPVGVDADGNAIWKDEINKRYEWLNQLNAKKVKLYESLSATRRERIKAGVATGKDPASYLTDLMRKKIEIIEMRVTDNEAVRTRKLPPEISMATIMIDDEEMENEES